MFFLKASLCAGFLKSKFSITSKLTGTFAISKTYQTELISSGPIITPGKSVAVFVIGSPGEW